MRRPSAYGKLECFYKGSEGKPVVYIARYGMPLERRTYAQPRLRSLRSGRVGKIAPSH